ncbi:phosphate signaling complex protein PhoU [Microvirga sp. M2]|uniref:phosphate signaling complex protein PhoU n=1 Tax=Microvirga sp. M2 TaxID=3073270 RepID=UPI0039C3A677
MTDHHIVTSYDIDLQNLRQSLLGMGKEAEGMLKDAVSSLAQGDIALAESVIVADPRLDCLRRHLEEQAVLLIARRQPMAIDLREIISTIRLAGDLERIGDLAKNNAKRVPAIRAPLPAGKVKDDIRHLSDLVLSQLGNALDAYARRDDVEALEIWRNDASIDELYTAFFREVLQSMIEHHQEIASSTHLLFCAKNIERIGDHIASIAETVHYLLTGESLGDRPKQDRSYFETVEPSSGP